MQTLDDWLEDDIQTTSPTLYQKDFIYKTKKITFSMHYKHKLITVDYLHKFIVSDEKKIWMCSHDKPCSNFNNCWACPPIAPSFEKYNKKGYTNCLVYAFWVDWDFEINSDNQYFKLVNANRTLSPYTWKYGQLLEHKLGGKDMIDGRCPLCTPCKASLTPREPCTFPKQRRSSLEALGIDDCTLSEEVLHHKIYWYKKEGKKTISPPYLTCIHGLLTNSEQPEEMLCLSL